MFDYCDISLWPTASLKTYVSHCCWICTTPAGSRLLWMNELCNKSYLFFQTLAAKSLSCTDYEIVTKRILPPETLLELQRHILWSTITMFLDIIHRLVFCLKSRPVYISKHNVSETGFYLRSKVKPTLFDPIDRASPHLRTPVTLSRWGT
jgi:hypothetical protein